MSDPSKATDSEQASESENLQTEQKNVEQPPVKPRKRLKRSWILFSVLVLLAVLLIVRDDLRQNAAESIENAVRYVAFDILGWVTKGYLCLAFASGGVVR
jgi:peptidoglycan LD-endopeptidase LytH|tara:strand:+ start:94 stop:393 length:300 start_codon:yes stop_codon:yes gene_type:complete